MNLSFNRKLILIFDSGSWTFQGNAGLKMFFKDLLSCLINIPLYPSWAHRMQCALFVCACEMIEAASKRGLTLIEPCSAIPKEEMVSAQDTELQFCRHRLFNSRHANQPICRLWTKIPRHYSPVPCSTWLSCILCLHGWCLFSQLLQDALSFLFRKPEGVMLPSHEFFAQCCLKIAHTKSWLALSSWQ